MIQDSCNKVVEISDSSRGVIRGQFTIDSGWMASVVKNTEETDDDVLFKHADVAPSPSKDYCQIVVTKTEVGRTLIEFDNNRLQG